MRVNRNKVFSPFLKKFAFNLSIAFLKLVSKNFSIPTLKSLGQFQSSTRVDLFIPKG